MDSNNNKQPMINREQSMATPLPARIMELTGPEEMPIERKEENQKISCD